MGMTTEKPFDATGLSESLRKAVDERVRVIMANREAYLSAWVAEHGFAPSESVIVEKTHPDGTLEIYVRRRTEDDR